ncbi:PhzF family phenazine biosynthesis protein [Altererythrobacter sp. MF3-039]|uniref:PhzF family phenazine biosynthesis protein n=1 Tax=Altererythrobacter sp. MF3-039 TaxID=3252901 RepID=UPI00390C7BF6
MELDLIDVFGSAPMRGNQLGVVHGAESMTDEQMLRLTQWLGFSETTFLLPPTDPAADYRVRIFYPAGELPFAGHPTLGSCHAWLESGGQPIGDKVIVQECGIGLVEIRRNGERLSFRAPELSDYRPLDKAERAKAVELCGVNPDSVVEAVDISNGPNWQLLRLDSADAVLAANPVAKAPAGTDLGLAGPVSGGEIDWEIRAFFGDQNGTFREDPVTGSFNAGVAVHLFETGQVEGNYRAAQGRETGADGLIHCSRDEDGSIWIGGTSATVSSGAALPLFV